MQSLSELQALFGDILNDSIQALITSAFLETDGYFLELFDVKWLETYQPIEEIFNNLNNSFEIFDKLNREHHTTLFGKIQRKVVVKYLTSMLRRKVSFSKQEEREAASSKIKQETNIYREFFQAVAVTEEEKCLDVLGDLDILETISNIVRADEEMITFELMTLVRNKPSQIVLLTANISFSIPVCVLCIDTLPEKFLSKTVGLTEDHLVSLLLLRGVSRAEARQISADILQDREQSQQSNDIFTHVKVLTGLLSVKNILG